MFIVTNTFLLITIEFVLNFLNHILYSVHLNKIIKSIVQSLCLIVKLMDLEY